jgi:hypothetical protein
LNLVTLFLFELDSQLDCDENGQRCNVRPGQSGVINQYQDRWNYGKRSVDHHNKVFLFMLHNSF